MLSLHALVPDSSLKGKLVQAPLGFKHHLALIAQPSVPSGEPLAEEILSRPVPKKDQPEGLKMRFHFSGSETQLPGAKLTGSGKDFAKQWAKTLEKRQKEKEEEELRAQQMEEEAEAEEDDDEEEQTEQDEEDEDEGTVETADIEVEAEVEPEQEKAETAGKKRKGDHMEVESTEEKKVKKEKKEKKEKKSKE